jgi:hypothetical protein
MLSIPQLFICYALSVPGGSVCLKGGDGYIAPVPSPRLMMVTCATPKAVADTLGVPPCTDALMPPGKP